MSKAVSPTKYGLIVPERSEFMRGYDAGWISYADRYNREIAPLRQEQKIAVINWMSTLHRIHEVVQVGVGQRMRARLKELSPLLASAATQYQNSLLPERQLEGRRAHVDEVINGVRYVTSQYQDAITRILSGEDDGTGLKAMHNGFAENDFRAALFEPFEGPSSGGRKPGMGRGRRLLAERILERSEGSAFGKVKAVREEIATWDEKTRRWIPKPDISDDDIAVLRAATKINYKNASDRVNKLLRDYEHKTST